jgi:hypothetical protein
MASCLAKEDLLKGYTIGKALGGVKKNCPAPRARIFKTIMEIGIFGSRIKGSTPLYSTK